MAAPIKSTVARLRAARVSAVATRSVDIRHRSGLAACPQSRNILNIRKQYLTKSYAVPLRSELVENIGPMWSTYGT